MTDAAAAERTATPAGLPDSIRHRFPIFERLHYLNSCSQGALSDSVRQAYADYLRDWEEQGAPWAYWVERAESARAAFARLIGASPDEVAVTTSLSQGVSHLISGLRFAGERTKIVVSDFEFPTVGQIAHAQELRGVEVVHVPEAGDATIPLERWAAAIDERTALVAFPHVCYRNGSRLDVPAIAHIAHEQGAPVLLDAYQAAGVLPIDVEALKVDFLATGTVKYLLGSAGLGFLYCRHDLVGEILPTETGWFADEDIFAMDIHDYSPSATARRFEAGTPPIPNIYAGIAGIELVLEIGVDETAAHVQALNDMLIEGLDALGAHVVTPCERGQRGPLIAVKSTDEHALVAAMQSHGIVVSSRDGNLRISSHAYNAPEDVEALLVALARHRHLLAA
jgi:selenocysteine lyase/cysteine desulfurase